MADYTQRVKLEYLHENTVPELAFKPEVDFQQWRNQVEMKLRGLLGDDPEKVDPELNIEFENDCGDFIDRRFVFFSEAAAQVPCHLLLPKQGDGPFPLVICLQGHSTGMHISLGRPKFPGDEESIAGGRDFGIQAVKEGYAALVMEQRGFGERIDGRPEEISKGQSGCHHMAMNELMYGRTLIGLRCWDVSRVLDVLEQFPELDLSRVGCMGNSGGGTITYFSSCLDPRIKVSMPSCYVCTLKDSIGWLNHCACNYVPGLAKYFKMGDLAGLIAPRPLIVVAGREDDIFPIIAVEKTFELISKIYTAAGASDNCRLLVGDEGHRFYPDLGWPTFRELSGWK